MRWNSGIIILHVAVFRHRIFQQRLSLPYEIAQQKVNVALGFPYRMKKRVGY